MIKSYPCTFCGHKGAERFTWQGRKALRCTRCENEMLDESERQRIKVEVESGNHEDRHKPDTILGSDRGKSCVPKEGIRKPDKTDRGQSRASHRHRKARRKLES